MEEGASPPRWALDKKLGEDASMEEKGATVVMTEEKEATVVAILDEGSMEGSFGIFENKVCG